MRLRGHKHWPGYNEKEIEKKILKHAMYGISGLRRNSDAKEIDEKNAH